MHKKKFDVLALGDSVIDVIAPCENALIEAEGFVKGSMQRIDYKEALRLQSLMGGAQEISGGSAANSVAGIVAMGGSARFVGQIGTDRLGELFTHSLNDAGVDFSTPAIAEYATGRCLIFVTPDAQRTMNTYRGASAQLNTGCIHAHDIAGASILYLEAYLWDHELPRQAMRSAASMARAHAKPVAFTLSDVKCIDNHRDDFLEFLQSGAVDILFGNESEYRRLVGVSDKREALRTINQCVATAIMTNGEHGAEALHNGHYEAIDAVRPAALVDTTGAGDMFAAGYLLARARGRGLSESLTLGAKAAAEIVSDYGARPKIGFATRLDD